MLHDSIKEKCVLDIYSYLIEELWSPLLSRSYKI
jgi:hypothetical protein